MSCLSRRPRARLRLLCLPYAGGGHATFRGWPARLPESVEAWTVLLPGRERKVKEPPFTRVRPLVASLADAMGSDWNVRFALFGHSLGALLAFELCRTLRRRGERLPIHLFVSGHRACQLPDSRPATFHLPDAQFIEVLEHLNGTPRAVLADGELMELMLPVLRADFEAAQTYEYVPESPLDCAITVFGGRHDDDVPIEHLEAWRIQTTGEFHACVLPGDHFFLHSEEAEVLRAIAQRLGAVSPAHGPVAASGGATASSRPAGRGGEHIVMGEPESC